VTEISSERRDDSTGGGDWTRPAFANRWTFLYAVAALLTVLNFGHFARDGLDTIVRGSIAAGLVALASKFAWGWLQTLIVLALASPSRRLLRWWSALLVLCSVAAAYYTFRLRQPIDRSVLHAVLVTDKAEVRELVDPVFIALVLLVGIPLAWLCVRARIGPPFFVAWRVRSATTAPLAASLALFAVLTIVHFGLRQAAVGTGYDEARRFIAPFNVVLSGGQLAAQLWRSRVVKVHDISRDFAATAATAEDRDPEIVVIVIGESARSANFGIAGYGRDTTPRLAKEQDLAVFPNVTACRTMTAYSVPCLMSRATIENFNLPLRETSLVGILRGVGYDTYWYATQGSMRSEPIMRLCREAGVCQVGIEDDRGHDYDGLLLPYVRHVIDTSSSPKRAIVLHTRGSHFVYYFRYPREFSHFTPECTEQSFGCERDNVLNSYDNSIRYTDHVLAEIIAMLRDKKAALFYTPDHGESLGERLFFGHGSPVLIAPKEQLNVPIVVWMSERFQRARGIKVADIRPKTSATSITHDHFFHSVLGCLGLKSALLDQKLDFCNLDR